MDKKTVRFYFAYTINAAAVVIPFVLLIMPKDYFDQGQSICISQLLFHTECYACGMTRAIMHLIHFDFAAAWNYNKLAFIVLPMLFPIWLKAVYFVFRKEPPKLLRKLV